MAAPSSDRRLGHLPVALVGGRRIPVATGLRARLLGLAFLDREEAGVGLLIPRCSSVHTFGMRFALDLVFIDGAGRPLAVRHGVPPRRFAYGGRAAAVLELPSRGCSAAPVPGKSGSEGGEFRSLGP